MDEYVEARRGCDLPRVTGPGSHSAQLASTGLSRSENLLRSREFADAPED